MSANSNSRHSSWRGRRIVLKKDSVIAGARYMALGFGFAGTIVAAVAVGYYGDRYLGTTPWLMLVLTLGGFLGAVQSLLWSLKRFGILEPKSREGRARRASRPSGTRLSRREITAGKGKATRKFQPSNAARLADTEKEPAGDGRETEEGNG